MRVYGIYWTREGIEPGERIEAHEVAWMVDSDYTEVRHEFDQRDDKYWPSVLFSADITNMTLVEEGTCPPGCVVVDPAQHPTPDVFVAPRPTQTAAISTPAEGMRPVDGIGVSRVVVVDYRKNAQKRGRAYDSHYPCDVDVVLQDDGKTLKAFIA